MKSLVVFMEKDVFPEKEDHKNIIFEDRITGKAIVFDDKNNVALICNRVNSFCLLPGGGVDDGESIENAIIRECYEEMGFQVQLLDKIGIIEDYRNRDKKHCISHCYTAKLVGEHRGQRLTENEERNGIYVKWVLFEEARSILGRQVEQLRKREVQYYNTGFNILRDHFFFSRVHVPAK